MTQIEKSSTRRKGACTEGFEAGQLEVKALWREAYGGDCDKVWNLEKATSLILNLKFQQTDQDSWRQKMFKSCARDGGQKVVAQYQKECLEDLSEQCMDLAIAAAETIVRRYDICQGLEVYHNYDLPPKYEEKCRQFAAMNCPGEIRKVLEDWCPESGMEALENQIKIDLVNECKSAVHRLTQSTLP